jgi:hypothetical protein
MSIDDQVLPEYGRMVKVLLNNLPKDMHDRELSGSTNVSLSCRLAEGTAILFQSASGSMSESTSINV